MGCNQPPISVMGASQRLRYARFDRVFVSVVDIPQVTPSATCQITIRTSTPMEEQQVRLDTAPAAGELSDRRRRLISEPVC